MFLLLSLMDKARSISLSSLSLSLFLSLFSICVPFVPLSFLSFSCSPICPVASTVLLLAYPSAHSLSQPISVLLFSFSPSVLNSVSLISAWSPLFLAHQCVRYARLVAETAAVPVTSVEELELERERDGRWFKERLHTFFFLPCACWIDGIRPCGREVATGSACDIDPAGGVNIYGVWFSRSRTGRGGEEEKSGGEREGFFDPQ